MRYWRPPPQRHLESLSRYGCGVTLAAAPPRGWSFPGEPTSPHDVLWCGIEEALAIAACRFSELDADGDRIQISSYGCPDLYGEIRSKLST